MVEQKIIQIKPNQLENYVVVIDSKEIDIVSETFIKVCKKYSNKFQTSAIVGSNNPDGQVINKKTRDADIWPLGNNYDDVLDVHWTQYFCSQLKKCFQYYAHQKVKDYMDLKIQDVQILRYPVNGHYAVHYDHHNLFPRTLSFIIFLNDDYEGGDLQFLFPDERNIFNVKKNKGRIVIFPSNFLFRHRIMPVTKGERYSLVAWMD